jgi:radical SAM protein with 4Fe4S-binding SPASM domain
MSATQYIQDFQHTPEENDGTTPTVDTRPLPYVVSWNLTKRCDLACAHCYISAGSWHTADDELTVSECRRITDEIMALTPAPMFILTGGEPLLRTDLEEIANYASSQGATVVVGTNGTGLTEDRIASLKAAGVMGFAVSVDSLNSTYHDRFRHGDGALELTTAAIDRLQEAEMDFIVQTTITPGNRDELSSLVAWSAERGAVSFNLYFLVETGRGSTMRTLTAAQNDDVLRELTALQREYRGRMLIRSKCQPQWMRHIHEQDQESPLLNYSTRCPCGVQYCRITPEGKVTPCPYLPAVAGDLRTQSFAEIWETSPLLRDMQTGTPKGKCGECEYRKVCGGCRARAYARTGDHLAADDSCFYEPPGDLPLVQPRQSVTYGTMAAPTLVWTAEADGRMQRIPSFVRSVVVKRVEDYARRNGHAEITPELLDDIRKDMPIDFSKRLPFFLRKKS